MYPDQLEIGLVPALRAVIRRLPTTIAARLTVSDGMRALDDPAHPALTRTERLLAVRVVEEAVTNALRHGHASSIEIELRTEGAALVLVVSDDGAGFDPAQAIGSGLARLENRLALVGGGLAVSSALGAGTEVRGRLPVGTRPADGA